MKFCIYRLCENKKCSKRLIEEGTKYSLPKTQIRTGTSFHSLLQYIIKSTKYDYVLFCQDKVVLPLDIFNKVDGCIKKCDKVFGRKNWGIVGNLGVEFLSNKIYKFINKPKARIIPIRSSRPIIATYLDDNTLLLNVKNIRDHKVTLPIDLAHSEASTFALLINCYRNRLICTIDSSLYVRTRPCKKIKSVKWQITRRSFSLFWKEYFINKEIYTSEGAVSIKNSLSYLQRNSNDSRVDFYNLVFSVLQETYPFKEKICISIIIRTVLGNLGHNYGRIRRALDSIRMVSSLNSGRIKFKVIISVNNVKCRDWKKRITEIEREYTDLNFEYLYTRDYKMQYPRVAAYKSALKKVERNAYSYVLFLDEDDFLFPVAFKYYPFLLHQDGIFIGDTYIFEEEWREDSAISIPLTSKGLNKVFSKDYFKNILGSNYIHNCAVIYPADTICKIFETYDLKGDYTEDYAFFLLAYKNLNVFHYPILVAGVSFHKTNTVLEAKTNTTHWDYSYVTFISELVTKGYITSGMYDYIDYTESLVRKYKNECLQYDKEYRKLRSLYFQIIDETSGFKKIGKALVNKVLRRYINIKGKVIRAFKR